MELIQLDKDDNDIIYSIGKKLLILLFDVEEEDLDKNKIVDNDDENENLFSDNETFNEEIIISTDEEVNDNNLNNLIHTFKSNIDEMIKSYVKLNYNQNFNDINLKEIISGPVRTGRIRTKYRILS